MDTIPQRLLTNRETESTILILEQAVEFHLEWLMKLHKSLVCNQPFEESVYKECAHELCKLGKWYYNDAPEALKGFDAFHDIELVHRKMHDCARAMAQSRSLGSAIAELDYTRFFNAQQQLSKLLLALRDELLKTLYSFDPLTGAMNRQAFKLIAQKEHALAVRTASFYSVAIIDLDHFKKINDRFGHIAGDKTLKFVARHFIDNLRNSDTFCRYGGEEFMVFLPNTTCSDAFKMLDALRESLAQTTITLDDGITLQVSASIGLAQWQDDLTLTDVIALADKRLYDAKAGGRNLAVSNQV